MFKLVTRLKKKHWNNNAKTTVERFGCFTHVEHGLISVLFQLFDDH